MVWPVCVACLASSKRATDGLQQSSQDSLGLGVLVFFPQFLVAQVGFSSKLETAAQLGVAPVLQLVDEHGDGGLFGGLRFGLQQEAFIPEDGLKRSIQDLHFDLPVEAPAPVIQAGKLIGIGRGIHVIDRGGVQRPVVCRTGYSNSSAIFFKRRSSANRVSPNFCAARLLFCPQSFITSSMIANSVSANV